MGCMATACWKPVDIPISGACVRSAYRLWECVGEHVSGTRLTPLDGVPNMETMDNLSIARHPA